MKHSHLSELPMIGAVGRPPSAPTDNDNASSWTETSTKNLNKNDGGKARRYSH